MPVSREEVRRIAALAHLELDEAAAERLGAQLDQILDYISKLDELDTAGVAPALGVTEAGEPPREDSPRPSLPIEDALANAPEPGERQFKVPRILPG